MNRTILVVLLVMVAWLAAIAPALSADRTSIGLGVGYRSKKFDLKASTFDPALPDLDENLEAMAIEQEYDLPVASIHLSLLDYVDLMFLFGSLTYDLRQASDLEGYSHDYQDESGSVFGFGGKLVWPVTERLLVGVYFEHFTADLEDIELATPQPTLSFELEEDGLVIPIDSITPEKLKYRETTVTPTVAMKFDKFMPYAGPRFTKVSGNLDVSYMIFDEPLERTVKYDESEAWSLVFGVTVWLGDNLSVTAEVETLERESYAVGVKYNF